MTRVFVLHQPVRRDPTTGELRPYHDLSAALQYGRVVNVIPPGPASCDHQTISDDIYERLLDEEINPDDYILALGDPAVIAIGSIVAADILARNGAQYLQLLKWDRRMGGYVVCQIPIG